MLHGHGLTPLGRQLRSVLASLSFSPRVRHPQARPRPRHIRAPNGLRNNSTFSGVAAETNTFQHGPFVPELSAGDGGQEQQSPIEDGLKVRQVSGVKADDLTEALEEVGYTVSQYQRKKRPQASQQKNAASFSLKDILARYIREEGRQTDVGRNGKPKFVPSTLEAKILARQGFTARDITAWADVLLTSDTNEAARKLANRPPGYDPWFVLMHLLQREFISANALRTIIQIVSRMLDPRANGKPTPRSGIRSISDAIVCLLRHAREIWPQSLPAIVSLFIGHLQHQDETLTPEALEGQIQYITLTLNNIMSLVSLSTAVLPFKDNIFQEMAIIPVLRYMDAHDPPLQITRPGYRAVIRIQLAQRKTPDEQRWAELKALSWPPWKVDRTAMDSSVGLEYGITRARATLFSMRNAGYMPLAWEKAAELYTGWDPDGTPTIQRRVLMGASAADDHQSAPYMKRTETALRRTLIASADKSNDSKANRPDNRHYWSARIDSTRTIQEAWACYLAWEDAKTREDQDVYLTIMQKLHEEAHSPHNKSAQKQPQEPPNPAWDLLPGDTPQISPLPPSTHLYTYTRTQPPTLDEFYKTLRSQGVQFKSHTLAFLLRVSSLEDGLRRIKDALPQYPSLKGILTLDPTYDLSVLPVEIFTASVQLLSRSGGYFLNSREWRWRNPNYKLGEFPAVYAKDHTLEILHLNKNSVIVRAVELLRRRPDCERRTWVAVFIGLTRESNFGGLGMALSKENGHKDVKNVSKETGYLGALLAYSMTRRLVSLYREQFGDLDPVGFYRFCLVSESLVRAVWSVMLWEGTSEMERKAREQVMEWDHDGRYIASHAASGRLRKEFWALVGSGDARVEVVGGGEGGEVGDLDLPRLLHIPNPALLHVYIRALGWLADYASLLELVRWMRQFREELTERLGRDRSGRDMMRKAIVALRVFCERSWRVGDAEATGDVVLSISRPDIDVRLSAPAEVELVEEMRGIVDSVEEWEGWATDEEVQGYVSDGRFDGLRG